ncbi:MAG TPA: hypothetical protein VFC18_01590 [Burkholderiales bacterium]|nr:hypothetical protein [Burkholderiales bacterium]
MASPEASAARLVGGVILAVGLAAFGALLWICRRVIASERAWDVGDLAILSVFALFGTFCLWAGWRLLRSAPEAVASSTPAEPTAPTARRVTVSHRFAAVGVAFMILSVLIPEQWYPVLFLFGGLVCLVVSHVLTPCEERMEKLKKARTAMRQL